MTIECQQSSAVCVRYVNQVQMNPASTSQSIQRIRLEKVKIARAKAKARPIGENGSLFAFSLHRSNMISHVV